MARSLGLVAYRALSSRGEAGMLEYSNPRPTGELVWIHAVERGSLIAVLDLAARLISNRVGINILVTLPAGEPLADLSRHGGPGLSVQNAPGDHPEAVSSFLDHWSPDVCLWLWGGLQPNLVLAASERGCPMILLDADAKGFDSRRDRWMPDVTRKLLKTFSQILVRSDEARNRLIHLGLSRSNIDITSPLSAGGQALPCADSDLTDLSVALGGRPVWFAAQVQPSEVQTVLLAHRQAMRLSHRLLLILNPVTSENPGEVANNVAEQGFDVILWDEGEEPDDSTQVMLTTDAADRGLFFRVAPVSFLGSSLVRNEGGCDPFEAAALGSAVLYGPKVRDFLPSYTRLAAAGAARIVNDAPALGTAVSRLIAPDQAATMAHAGWDVISQGAALMDKVTDLVQTALDERAQCA